MKKKIQQNRKIIIVAIVIISFLILSVTMAKYIFRVEDVHQIESTTFYFNSDIAQNEESYYTEEWDGTNTLEISFSVNNYENQNLVTNEDITFSLEAEKQNDINNEITAKVYDKNVEAIGTQMLAGGTATTKNYVLKISKNSEITADEFNIKLKINSVSPYKKELIGNIKINILKSNNEIKTSLEDNGEYVSLKINTNDVTESKTISYDNTKLTLDKANVLLQNVNVNTNSFTIPKANFEANKEYEIIFIKNDNSSEIELGKDVNIN